MADNENQRIMNKNENNMDSSNTSSRIPKLRFPGFTGEWEEKKLGEMAEFKRGTTITAKETVDGDVPVIAGGQTPSYYHNVANREGQTIAISGSGAYAGFVSFWETPVFLSDSFSVDTNSELDRKYLFYYLKHRQHALFQLQKGAGVPHVHGSDVGELYIPFPSSLAEQQKIAECLSELDNLITAQGQKVDALKEKKKGLMQQLFPQKGETVPRLRFPGFEEEWNEKKLGDILVERKEVSVITEELPQLSFTIAEGVIRPEDRKTNQRDFLMKDKDSKKFSITRLNDIIYNPANVVYGAIHKNNLCDGVVSPIYKIFWTNENADFINYLLRRPSFISTLSSHAEGTVTKLKTLKAEAFLELSVPFPVDPSEQQKIAECLSALDETIVAEADKLEALKNHKKGLMQQLFPQPSK